METVLDFYSPEFRKACAYGRYKVGLRDWCVEPFSMQHATHFTFLFNIAFFRFICKTTGEKLVLVGFNSDLDQAGVYGLVSNLGSLVARLCFQPIGVI